MKSLKTLFCTTCFFVATSHGAVKLSDNGHGEMLIAPFYTVANNMASLISIKNTQREDSKAVKVRIKESFSGIPVLEFNLYLNPNDAWAGALSMNNLGEIVLTSDDQSCTFGFNSPQALNLSKIEATEPETAPEDLLTRIQTGSIEIYDMGTENLQQRGCSAIDEAWAEGGQWANDPALGPVTGGLNATLTLIQVANGFAITTPISAFNDFYAEGVVPHTLPDSDNPNLNDADPQSQLMMGDELIKTNWPSGFQSVGGLITYSNLSNDYNVSLEINGKSEWVFTFPTKSYAANTEDNIPFNGGLVNDSGEFCMMDSVDCFGNESFDRDSNNFCFLSVISPPPPPSPSACHSTNVMVMVGDNQTTAPASELSNFSETFLTKEEGWFNKDLKDVRGSGNQFINTLGVGEDQTPHTYYGLPVIGFTFNQYTNLNAQPGLLATYATVDPYETTRQIETPPQ